MKCDNVICKEKATETRKRRSEPAAFFGHAPAVVFKFCKTHAERYDARQRKAVKA